ncbi:Antiviral helicase ski2 [Elasticomyces elasticus]|nr:Antiviral helicase ski2 [Elasticomyces elasticus]
MFKIVIGPQTEEHRIFLLKCPPINFHDKVVRSERSSDKATGNCSKEHGQIEANSRRSVQDQNREPEDEPIIDQQSFTAGYTFVAFKRCQIGASIFPVSAAEHDVWVIKDNISSIRQLMSDQNLQLLPDYQQRINVLKDLGFIDDNSRGKVACEIDSADELVLTELVLENVLVEYEPEEIVALLSSFVFQEKTDSTPNMTPALERCQETIVKVSEKVNEYQTLHQDILSSDDSNDFVSKPRFGLVEVVHEWARGMPFSRITDLTDVLEGTIVE